ncbi:MAG: DUF4179 domain-containing protein [Anaerovoracaceae bacterium]
MDYRDRNAMRMSEYEKMMNDLEAAVPPELESVFDRASARERKHRRVMRFVKPAGSIAAVFACFVLSVNFITPVAQACSKIPVLKDLAAAVDFSGSLSRAVENNYVQPIGLSQTKNGIKADIDYVIVDQKQVNIFYRLEYETEGEAGNDIERNENTQLAALIEIGKDMPPHGISWSGSDEEEGRLRSVTIDFTDSDVPETIPLVLKAKKRNTQTWNYAEENLAVFTFTLEIDPYYTAQGRTTELNEELEILGQNFTLTTVDIYPTHLQLNVESDDANTMWLKSLSFYVEASGAGDDNRLETVNGISALGSKDTPEVTAFRKESPWFFDTENLKIVITGARLAEKDMEGIKIKVTEPDAGIISGKLPDGVRLDGVTKQGRDDGKPTVEISFKTVKGIDGGSTSEIYEVFEREYVDGEGREGYMETYAGTGDDAEFTSTLVLKDYAFDTVTVYTCFTHCWKAGQLVEITVMSYENSK